MGYLGLAVWMTVPRDDSELPSNGRCSGRQFCFCNTASVQWRAARGMRIEERASQHTRASPLHHQSSVAKTYLVVYALVK